MQEIEVPESIREMFTGLSEEDFRMDISSTEIRERLAAAHRSKAES
jgi:hypothetical protein